LLAPLAAFACLYAAQTLAGEIILYEHENFSGQSMRIVSEVTSLDGTGFNDKTQSAVVRSGVWEVCRDAYFSGGCIQLQPGRYPRMDPNFVRNISSVREVDAAAYAAQGYSALAGQYPPAGYASPGGYVPQPPGYAPPPPGYAPGPGYAPQPGPPPPPGYIQRPECYAPPPPGYGPPGYGAGTLTPYYAPPTVAYAPNAAPQVILYEGHDFQGRQFTVSHNMVRSLDPTGFNDRAESLRVMGGYWVFCSDANFEGECRTFGPGEYPNLPRELDRRISSGRLLSSAPR
jgi:hypothetical protein